MEMLPITIRKRTIGETDLELIQATIDQHWQKGRTQISKILCQKWNWVQTNGRLKDMACREILLTLYRIGLINLPPGKHDGRNLKRNRSIPLVEIDQSPLEGKLSTLPTVKLKLVRNSSLEPLYNSLVQQHHYLGYRQIVGNHLKYMAFIDDRPVACLGWPPARRGEPTPRRDGTILPKKQTSISWLITLAFLFYFGSPSNAWPPRF